MPQLITFEGLDGSGKSSSIEQLRTLYSDRDDILFTRQPTQDTHYGSYVYDSIADGDADPLAELFLYMADHANHLENTIKPALNAGTHVICDRYLDSRIAYQAATLAGTLPEPFTYIQDLHFNGDVHTTGWSHLPTTTFYLDVSPEVAAERSGRTNKFEAASYLELVQENYDRLREEYSHRYVSIDAEREQETVQADIISKVEKLVN